MGSDGFGDFFISEDDELTQVSPLQPVEQPAPAAAPEAPAPTPAYYGEPASEPEPALEPAPEPEPELEPEALPVQLEEPVTITQQPDSHREPELAVAGQAPVVAQAPVATSAPYAAAVSEPAPPVPVARPETFMGISREQRLAEALDLLMNESQHIEAAALVSLDGFTMASALPEGMHEDRVGAMSAAILGLGERAAAELGRGKLSQVFIEGKDGYVLLIAAGDRAVLTCLAGSDAKLGLVLYDMRDAAAEIGEIIG